jgi:hypothetical protein
MELMLVFRYRRGWLYISEQNITLERYYTCWQGAEAVALAAEEHRYDDGYGIQGKLDQARHTMLCEKKW